MTAPLAAASTPSIPTFDVSLFATVANEEVDPAVREQAFLETDVEPRSAADRDFASIAINAPTDWLFAGELPDDSEQDNATVDALFDQLGLASA